MKIKYDLKKGNRFKVFNDSMGVALFSKSILENKKVKYLNYFTLVFLELLIGGTFLGLMLILLCRIYCILSLLLTAFALVSFIYILFNSLTPLICAAYFLTRDEGELKIDKKGVSFSIDDDESITIGWSRIKGIIIGKHSINFITDEKYYFYLDKSNKKEVIDAIKKYNETIRIVK